jgi:hypothetical protein
MFSHRHGLPEAEGLKVGQRVTVLIETKGDDHESIEHTMPAGSTGYIECIKRLDGDQGLSFTVYIPVDESNERAIVNVFDELDGPITNFIRHKE